MKKILLTVLSLLYVCGISSAQHRDSENLLQKLWWDDEKLSIMIDTRMDFQSSFPSSSREEWSFQAQTIKLWLVGEIVPGIRYRLRHRLNKPQQPLREGYSGATDHAWIEIDAGRKKNWTFRLGKQSVQFGTFEFDYNPADVYLSSMVNNDIDSHKAGVNIAYHTAGQTFNLQVVNSDAPQFASDRYKNKGLGAAFLWEGKLWDGLVATRWGYAVFQHTKSRYYNWITPGIQLNIDKFTAELDYYYGVRNIDYSADISDQARIGTRFVRDQSASLNFRYDFGKWRPQLKGIRDLRYDKDSESDAYSNLGIEAVIEYYPFTNKYVRDLRFHLMYSYTDRNYKGDFSTMDNLGDHRLLAGLRWFFKAK